VTSKMAVIDQLYISETVLGELYYGAYHGDQTSRELGKIQEFLRGAAILYHDSATTRLVRVAPTNGMALVKSSRIPFEDSEASL
jgi:predicted nucleic acid-binding protein